MPTLLATFNSSGDCVGRCDARCYNAEHPKCICICNGANHGKGLSQASENTREMAESWLESIEHSSVEIPAMQLSLFEMEDET